MNKAMSLSEVRTSVEQHLGTAEQKREFSSLLVKIDGVWKEYPKVLRLAGSMRLELGKALVKLRNLLSHRGTGLYGQCLSTIGMSRSTAHDIVADYERVEALNLPQLVLDTAAELYIEFGAKRMAQVLSAHADALRKVKTREDALELLQTLKDSSKRRAGQKAVVNPKEHTEQQFDLLRKQNLAFFSVMDEMQKLEKLQLLISGILPGAVIVWHRPANVMEMQSAGLEYRMVS